MKTYTIKEILDNPKIIIFIENKEQFDKLSNIKELKLTDYYMGSYCYDPHSGQWSSSSTKTYPGAHDSDSIIITFEQIIGNIPEKGEDKPKFEVGKWYSFNWKWCISNPTVIAKIREVNEKSFSISWRSYLWRENDYNTFDRYKFEDISDIKELSLEEVQQYLPDGHPDKFKTVQSFEAGKWYKKDGYYLKPEKIIGTKSQHNTEYISPEGKYHANNSGIDDLRTWELLTDLTEIQQYLPDEHPDKIKNDIKFKVGNWVVNLEKSISYNVNEICRISKISKTHLACENKPQDEGYMKPFDKFRHATPEEIHRHLTFTRQMSAGDPINTGINPNINGLFSCKVDNRSTHGIIPTIGNCYNKDFSTSTIVIESKLLLSTDDDDLPMVNISEAKTIKTLLNND